MAKGEANGKSSTLSYYKITIGYPDRLCGLPVIYSDELFKNLTRKKCVLLSEFTTVKHRMCKIWSA